MNRSAMKLAGRVRTRRSADGSLTASTTLSCVEVVAMTAESIARSAGSADDRLELSDGEVHFLWRFIQGSIMNPETRERMGRAWGMCTRHAAALLAVEAAYRHGWMHACALLYLDLIERALGALTTTRGLFGEDRAIRRLHATGPCLICEMEIEASGGGAASADLLDRSPDPSQLSSLADDTRSHWMALVCRLCSPGAIGPLCRLHLVGDPHLDAREEIHAQRATLGYVARHLIRYARSSRWEHRDTETPEDRAALLEAVGWCSGWSSLLAIIGAPE